MATVKITPQLDTKPAIKSFNKLKKDMTNPSNQAQMSKLVRSFDFRKQLSDVGKMHTQFSKMAASSEKSQKRQEISAKIERIRKYKAIRDELSFQNKKETSIKRQSNLSKAYQRMDLIGSAGGGMAMAAGLQSHMGQYQGGGFSSLIHSQLSGVAGAKNYMSEKYQQWKADREEKKAQQAQENPNRQGTQGTPKSKMGQAITGLGSGTIVLEGFAKGVGAMVQLGSDMAEAHQAALNSQTSTFGATGGYVKSSYIDKDIEYKDANGRPASKATAMRMDIKNERDTAQGYFHDAEIAQGQVAFNRARGRAGNDTKGYGEQTGSMMKFASGQGVGYSQITQAMGSLGRAAGQNIKLEFIKGAATVSKMEGLKQSAFLTEFSSIVEQNRGAGFGEIDQKSFLQQSANLGAAGVSGERTLGITNTMNQAAQKGEKGGVMGSLALAAEMQRNGGDYFAAKRTLAEKGMQNYHADFARKTIGNDEVGGHLMGDYGLNQNEGEAYMRNPRGTIKDENVTEGAQNASIRMSNTKMGFDATNKVGAGMAEQMLQESINLLREITKVQQGQKVSNFEDFMKQVSKAESTVADVLVTSTDTLNKLVALVRK